MEGKNPKNQKQEQKEIGQPDRVVYSEASRINIGDYEHKEVFLSVSSDAKPGETIDQAIVRVKGIVRKKVYSTEKMIRIKTKNMVDFDTKSKLKIDKGSK